MADQLDESILDSMLQDPKLEELYGTIPDRDAIRKLLADRNLNPEEDEGELSEEDSEDSFKDSPRIGNIILNMDAQELTVRISLAEPEDGQPDATAEEIRQVLSQCGIVQGINETYIERLASTPVYRRPFVIAKGKPVIKGTEDTIKYYFEPEKNLRPKTSSDGRTDYMELEFAQTVKKGDLLCELISGVSGSDGYTVTGNIIKSSEHARCKIRSGQNTVLSDDQKQLFAACDGEVSIRDGKVVVDKVMIVENVDASTGNIRFIGSLYVRGKICEGFTVRITGNLAVGEVIEGADVSADGDIQVARGIKGANKGIIKAGGSLRTEYIENMEVSVKNDIFADVIMTSNVECNGKVSAMGRRGRLIGGCCNAMEIDAMEIGNDSQVKTELEIKGTTDLEWNCSQLEGQLKILRVAEKNLQVWARDDSNPNKMKAQKDLLAVIYQKNKLASRKQELEDAIRHAKACYTFQVAARAVLYPNVYLKIGTLTYVNKEVQRICILFQKDGHIMLRKLKYD